MSNNSCTICTLGLLSKGCFLTLHLNIAVFQLRCFATNCVRHDLSQNHVRLVRWVLVQTVPFLLCIYLSRFFIINNEQKPIRSVLINGMCDFEDVIKPPTASLWSGLLMYTHSRDTYSRTVQLKRRNTSRNGGEQISAEQGGCTRMRGTVLRKPPRRRSGITRGRYLSMRVPLVFPASDV